MNTPRQAPQVSLAPHIVFIGHFVTSSGGSFVLLQVELRKKRHAPRPSRGRPEPPYAFVLYAIYITFMRTALRLRRRTGRWRGLHRIQDQFSKERQ